MELILLKNNTNTTDRRLDRVAKFDRRSRQFPIRELIGADKTPRSYSWRCNIQLDQGNEGACVGFGVSHELAARPVEVPVTNKFARENIYFEAQKIDEWEGGAYPGASPFYEGTSVLAGIKTAQSLLYFDEYRWAFGLDDLIMGVGHNGPSVLGLNWYKNMFDTDAKGYIHPTGGLAGGHCILCRSVDVKKERFTLRNSWGSGWGINGECYVSFADMKYLLKKQGEAAFFIRRHKGTGI